MYLPDQYLEELRSMTLLQSDLFTTFANLISLIANLCVLLMTAYTLHLTAFSRKMSLVSMGPSFTMFFGESLHLHLKNQSLHAIPVTRVFLLKKIDDRFCSISIAKYEEPLIIDAWHIGKIESGPFTEIVGLEQPDGTSGLSDIHMNAVIGVESGDRIIWVKPYKKAPLWAARSAYKKMDIEILTVSRECYGDQVLSRGVRYAIDILDTDINGQKAVRTIFAMAGADGVIFSGTMGGHNGIEGKYFASANALKQHLCKCYGIAKEDIHVTEIHPLFPNLNDKPTS